MGVKAVGFDMIGGGMYVAAIGKGAEGFFTPLPDSFGDGAPSPELSGFIREALSSRGLIPRRAALVLPPERCYCRRLSLPAMTHKQLMTNLPFELREFIKGDRSDYYFDYAVIRASEAGLEIVAAAVLKSDSDAYRDAFREAGVPLVSAVPAEFAVTRALVSAPVHRHCILETLGDRSRLMTFVGAELEWSLVIDCGAGNSDSLARQLLQAMYYLQRGDRGQVEHIHLCGDAVELKDLLGQLLPVRMLGSEEFLDEKAGYIGSVAALGAAMGISGVKV